MDIIIAIIFLLIQHGFAGDPEIFWQTNHCIKNNQTIPSHMFTPPSDETCHFYAGANLLLINQDPNRIENIYQVRTMKEMLECNASNSINHSPVIVNDTAKVPLVAGNNLNFAIGDIIFFISTSNGSVESAHNDKMGSERCLSMIFKITPMPGDSDHNCSHFQFGNLAAGTVPTCSSTTESTPVNPTHSTENTKQIPPAQSTENNISPGTVFLDNIDNMSNFRCDAECILIILVSFLLFIIGSICCLVLIIGAILYQNIWFKRRKMREKRSKQIPPKLSETFNDPEKGTKISNNENKVEYQMQKISPTEEICTKPKDVLPEGKEVSLKDKNVDSSVIKLPEFTKPQKTIETAQAKPQTNQDKISTPKVTVKVNSPVHGQVSPTSKAKRLIPQIRSGRFNSSKVSPTKTVV